MNLSCLWNGHSTFPEARWVIGRDHDDPWQLWTFMRCKRCGRITSVRDSSQRWEGWTALDMGFRERGRSSLSWEPEGEDPGIRGG